MHLYGKTTTTTTGGQGGSTMDVSQVSIYMEERNKPKKNTFIYIKNMGITNTDRQREWVCVCVCKWNQWNMQISWIGWNININSRLNARFLDSGPHSIVQCMNEWMSANVWEINKRRRKRSRAEKVFQWKWM